jgi:hypothetical protein
MTSNALAKEKQKDDKIISYLTKPSANKMIQHFSTNDNYFLITMDEYDAIFGIKNSYEKKGNNISLWIVYVYGHMVKLNGKNAAYAKVHSVIDCDEKSILFLSMIFYDDKHTAIKVFDKLQYDSAKSRLIIPDMLDAVLYDAACPSTTVNTFEVTRPLDLDR